MKHLLLVCMLLLWPLLASAQTDADDEAREAFVVAFNTLLREEYEALPLARNEALDDLAQDIAAEVGCSDERIDFDLPEDAAERGYAPYPEETRARTTAFPLLPIVNQRPIEDMVAPYGPFIYENNINQTGRFYREIGVGVLACERPPETYALFVILGAQPDVIPVVIENGAGQLTVQSAPHEVTLSIHQENSRPLAGIFGSTERLRLSDEPLTESDFERNYRPTFAWTLEECGPNTVYYELIDSDELRVMGETTVELVCASPPDEE